MIHLPVRGRSVSLGSLYSYKEDTFYEGSRRAQKKIHFLMITLIVLHWHVHLVKVIFFVLANSFWSAEEVNREKKTALQTNTVLGMSFHISNIFINFLSNGLLNNNRDKLR